jgi:type III pantothenate kinase
MNTKWPWFLPESGTSNIEVLRNLVIDIGNTRTKAGVFESGELLETKVFQSTEKSDLRVWVEQNQVEHAIISIVGQAPDAQLMEWLYKSFNLLKLDWSTPLPFQNQYGTPKTLGKDRIAAVAGAWNRFPGCNSLVIDAGTCITYDLITAEGIYPGGNISPGISMRFKALEAFTAGLPLIAAGHTAQLTGNSTETAIRNGVQFGVLWEIESAICAFEAEWPELNVLLTGGDAVFFEKKLKNCIFVVPNLVLEGLNKILIYNVENPQ